FTNGAPPGNASDEDTHKWCPRDGPGPVEDGPSTLPAGVLLKGIVPQRQARQFDDVPADGFDRAAQQVQGRAGEQHEDEQDNRGDDVRIRQALDSFVQPQSHGHAGDQGHNDNQEDLDHDGFVESVEAVQTGADLHCAQADGYRDTEDGADDGDDVDGTSQRAVNTGAQQWRQD